MKIIYPAIFHKEDDTYWAEFPDLIGCQTYGDSLASVYENAKEALKAFTLTLLESHKRFPKVSDLKSISCDENSFVSYVDSDLTPYLNREKAVKKTLTIPAWLNDEACKEGINFSQTLQESLLHKLNYI